MASNTEETSTKATARIYTPIYAVVTKGFHYGYVTALMRALFKSIYLIIKAGNKQDIVNYMHGTSELTLPAAGDPNDLNE